MFQVLSGAYSANPARSLLRLYRLFPSRFNAVVTEIIFLRALMTLPDADFMCCLSLVPETSRPPAVPLLVELEGYLNRGQVREFWERSQDPILVALLEKMGPTAARDFTATVRGFIASILTRTYRRTTLGQVATDLGFRDEQAAREWVNGQKGWSVEPSSTQVDIQANWDNTTRPARKEGEDALSGIKFADASFILNRQI